MNYTFRMHDPRIGRFFAVDPLTKSYPHYTPYSFSGNKVISAIELEGLEEYQLSGALQGTITIGTKKQTNFNIGATFGAAVKIGGIMPAVNTSLNIFDGGLGTPQGTTGQIEPQATFVVSPSVTVAVGLLDKAAELPINTFNSSALSSINNTFKNSITIGQNFVFNTLGRNQRVGSYGARVGDFSLNIANDTRLFCGDKFDRWWTGSGQANILFGNGNLLSVGSDVFTGDFGGPVAGKLDPDNPEGGTYGTYAQTKAQKNLNNGQAFIRLKTTTGYSFTFSILGDKKFIDAGLTQDLIHDNLVPTPRFNYLATEANSSYRLEMSREINIKR